MKIDDLISELECVKLQYGNIECLVETVVDDCVVLMPVDDLNYGDRDAFGKSISLIY